MILRWLDPDEPISATHLAIALGMNAERVRGALGALQRGDIAMRVPSGWIRVGDADLIDRLDDVAATAGTLGQLDRDAERYEEERCSYRAGSGEPSV